MKMTKKAIMCLSAFALLMSAVSCSSDPTTITGVTYPSDKDSGKATIILNLSAAATRAEEDALATADEKKISLVNIYVFDANDKYEEMAENIAVTGNETAAITLKKSGLKTIYAVSANNIITSTLTAGTTTISDFENLPFTSTVANLKNSSNEIVMIGKSAKQMVMESGSATVIPATNVFAIEMERVVAKAQVKCLANEAGDATAASVVGINFKMGIPSYKVCQTNNTMHVANNDGIAQSFSNHDNGTYDGYTRFVDGEYTAQKSDFTASDCAYIPENIVADPKSGNTTFLNIKFKATPNQFYAYSDGNLTTADATGAPTDGTFYAVGIVDAASGMVDYVVDPDGTAGNIVVFKTSEAAAAYVSALNGTSAEGITVSDTDSPLNAPSKATRSQAQFQSVEFSKGEVYYRVNLKAGDICKVVRNQFYKVDIVNIKSLGVNSESLLYPTEPTTEPDQAPSTSIQATFTVTPWAEVDQSVTL